MTMTLTSFFAMATSSQNGDQPSLIGSLIPFVLIFGVFYFLLIAPARKKQKKHQNLVEGLKNGDKVITNGGLHGTVVGVSTEVVQLKIADQVRIDVSRNAIAVVQDDAS